MKLHRVLATATVTAVIGSVALFVSPAAYATGEAPTGGTPSASATPATAPEPSSSAGGADQQSPAGQPTDKAGAPSAPSAPSSTTGPAPSGSTKASPGTGESAEPSPTYTRPTFCSGIPDEERGKTSLRGFPSKIVAGSGWHDFAYRVTNVSKIKVMETIVSLDLGTADPKLDDIAQLAVTVQWFNPETGTWKAIQGEGADVFGHNGFATVKTLEPGEYADAKMRIKVDEKAEAGTGYFFTTGYSYGEDGQCGFDDISQFDFTVLAPGSEPGKVGDATGKPGKAEDADAAQGSGNTPAPQGGLGEIPVSGSLAETGSSSTLPTTAALGGAAVILGAGAVFVVRRRKAGSGTAA